MQKKMGYQAYISGLESTVREPEGIYTFYQQIKANKVQNLVQAFDAIKGCIVKPKAN